MNALQQKIAIDGIIDRVKSARFSDERYYQAINQAVQIFIDDTSESVKMLKRYSFQSSQRLRDKLYTLIAPTVHGAPSAGNIINMPDNYYYLTLVQAKVVDNITGESVKNNIREISYGEEGLIDRNPFKKPRIYKTYLNERDGYWQAFIPDNSTFTEYWLDYLKRPALVTIGFEDDKINQGGLIVINQKYYVYDECISNGVIHHDGELFTATSTGALTSGTVIPFAKVVNCDLPIKVHDEVNRLAAAILMNSLDNYLKENMLKKQNLEY